MPAPQQLRFADHRENRASNGRPAARASTARWATCASVRTPHWCLAAQSWPSPYSKDGGSRTGPRGGNSRSAPLLGPKRERLMLARFREPGLRPAAARGISRAFSRERPLPTASARPPRFHIVSSSRLRIVMLAIVILFYSLLVGNPIYAAIAMRSRRWVRTHRPTTPTAPPPGFLEQPPSSQSSRIARGELSPLPEAQAAVVERAERWQDSATLDDKFTCRNRASVTMAP